MMRNEGKTSYIRINYLIIFILIALCFWASGCQPTVVRPDDRIICPGKPSIEEAIRVLSLQRNNAQPFLARVDCIITYPDKDGRDRDEPVRNAGIAFVPNDKIYFKGDLVFKELRFGTNETQFWLRVKAQLEEFGDSYWWGFREDVEKCPETLPIHPGSIAEAFGIVEITPDWKMSNQDGYDILSLYENDRIKKQVYINTCDYRIEQIEYFDQDELRRVSVELDNYSAEESGIMVPTQIKVVSYDPIGAPELSISFKLKHVRPLPIEKQKKGFFERPGRDGYGHMYRLNDNCKFIEEENQ